MIGLGLIDWSFILTIVVVLLVTLIGSYLRSSRKDRCLEDFEGYHVTVEKKNNRVVWGKMNLHATGFELIYEADVQDDDRHLETSYIIYKDEYGDLQAIYRYARELNEEQRARRALDLQRSFHPGAFRRICRSIRNFFSTATESLGEVVGLIVGRARKPAANLISETSETYLSSLGKDLIGHVGTGYDPLLEAYVGSLVVMEVVEAGEIHEHVGVLKEYSAEFLEVLDIYYPLPQRVQLKGDSQWSISERVEVGLEGRQLRIKNVGDQPVFVEQIAVGNRVQDINAIVAGEERIELHVDSILVDITIDLRVASRLDMIVPRSHALIRHRAERYIQETIFDIGLSLVRRDGDDKEIERLQQVLRYSPHNAATAARLGELMISRGDLGQAHKWLLQALDHRRHLPDNGNRVAQHLRYVERRVREVPTATQAGPPLLAASDNGRDPAFQVEVTQESQTHRQS